MAEGLTIRPGREDPPCKKDGVDCPLRHPGCHGSCKKFLDWKAGNEVLREARQEYNRQRAIRVGKWFDPSRCHKGLREE